MFDYKKISLTDNKSEYDISNMQFTFDFIYLVLKHNIDVDSAIKGIANEYDHSESFFHDYFKKNIYIINRTNRYEFSKQIKNYSTKTLRKLLKNHGLDTSGRRKKLEKRIFDKRIFDYDYYLSSKSKLFYKNKKRRFRIFENELSDYYYFDEFNDFYMNNFRKKESKIPIEFIKQHINKAIEDKNHENYILNNQVMVRHYCKNKNYKKMLRHVLKNFCMNLNPIWKIGNLKNHDGLNRDTYADLLFLQNELSRNIIISAYYSVWDSFNFDKIIITKYEGYKYLKLILNLNNYSAINLDLNNRFYSNDDLKIKKVTQKTLFDY